MNYLTDSFMKNFKFEALTFDDVSLKTRYSETLPDKCKINSNLTKNISLNTPLLSAAMDTVTEWEMAVAMAKNGGIGIVHKNLSIQNQAKEVAKVKKFLNGFIEKPVYFYDDVSIDFILKTKKLNEYNFSSFPIISKENKLSGIITSHDLKFIQNRDDCVKKHMEKNVITGSPDMNYEEAYKKMINNKVGKLPIVNHENKLCGLYSLFDIKSIVEHTFSKMNVDDKHRLRVGAAVSPYEYERIIKLIENGVDVIVIDTAHGHSKGVIETIKEVKNNYSIDIIAGNIATSEAALDLYNAGADAVKVGIGPGSICTTRVVAGVGVPQITAIYDCARVLRNKIPVIADGGVRYSGDLAKAFAAGASSVMMGSCFAGCEESPGEKILYNGRKFVIYRGMGSLDAMKSGEGSRKRYFQDNSDSKKLVPEGIEGMVPYSGSVDDIIYQFTGGLRASMGYSGTRTIFDFHKQAEFVKMSAAGLSEAHPHDVRITKEAPNYRK
ncbi:MAG: IMP dehydrogenase [Candidatus Muiribacteriota bacterium]